MSPVPLLLTKLGIPPGRPNTIARGQLVALLNDGLRLGRRLSLICAPAGFGKTTLMRQWAVELDLPVTWLSLEAGDDQPEPFARYLATALDVAHPAGATPREIVEILINALADSGQPRLLVLDDYHAIRGFPTHDLVGYLLAHQPPCFHLAIGSREDPPLPLARLRARDQVTEIRERSLRFSQDEVASFFRQTLRLELPREAVTQLAARTEGWVTALQLAGLALNATADAPGFVKAFAGDDRYIVDYLMAEVLAEQPEAVRDFLRQTAILDRLSAPLCNAVTDREDSQAVLERLEADNLFLTPLDNRREWWRYHTLFAEALRFSLSPARQRELHLKAAAWCEAVGLPELALQHAQAAARLAPSVAPSRPDRLPQPLIEPLSERELEVLRLIAEGLSNQGIADRLIIAEGTVKRHINNIYGKLQVGSRTQAVAVARELGLL